MTSKERLKVLAAFIRNQVSLADRPPVGCVQLNNEEASLCADALEANEQMRALLIDAVPDLAEQWCDECGGQDAECPETCYVKRARTLLGKPQTHDKECNCTATGGECSPAETAP